MQTAGSGGTVTFTTIFPAAYSGRWPHIRFEVYQHVKGASSDGPIVKTSQIALPKEACDAVYATTCKEQSVAKASEARVQGLVRRDQGPRIWRRGPPPAHPVAARGRFRTAGTELIASATSTPTTLIATSAACSPTRELATPASTLPSGIRPALVR